MYVKIDKTLYAETIYTVTLEHKEQCKNNECCILQFNAIDDTVDIYVASKEGTEEEWKEF